MKMIKRLIIFLSLLLLIAGTASGTAKKQFIIGYFEGGSYFMHKMIMTELRDELERRAGDSLEIIFSPNAYFTAGWSRDLCKTMAKDLTRLKDIDLIIAAGPWVVEDLLAAGFAKPIVGIHQFDPQLMGLVGESGKPIAPNLTVNYQPNKIKNDMAAMLRVHPWRKIGLLYFASGDETDKLKNKLYELAGPLGAAVFSAKSLSQNGNYSFFLSLNELRKSIDILYLPPLWGMELEQIRQFFDETQNARLPIFSSEGFLFLEKGATIGNTLWPYRGIARFTTDKILKIANGAEPASLPTIYYENEELCLNLEAANKLNLAFPRKAIFDAKTIRALPGDTAVEYTPPKALEQAMLENAGYLEIGQKYERAISLARDAWQSFFPQFSLEIGAAGSDNGSSAAKYNPFYNRKFQTNIQVDQTVFSYPVLKAINIARKNLAIEKTGLQQTRLDLKQAIVTSYLSILENEEKIAVMNETTDRLRKLRDDLKTGARIGQNNSLDVLIVEEQLIKAKIDLFKIEGELKTSRLAFSVLINRPGDDNFVLDRKEFSPDIIKGMVTKYNDYTEYAGRQRKLEQFFTLAAIKNSTGIKTAEEKIGIQRSLIESYKYRYLPEVVLQAGYSYGHEFSPKISDDKDFWTIGGTLRFPISFGGSKSKGLKAGLDELLYHKDNLRLEQMQEIIGALNDFTLRLTTLPMNYYSRNLSNASRDSAAVAYSDGKLPIYQLIQDENNCLSTTLAMIAERFEFFYAYTDLLGMVGVGYLMHGTSEETEFYKELENFMGN
jgi:outer membrane protein TolC/ABC-type uncharacterized transport system substrate-binding protein